MSDTQRLRLGGFFPSIRGKIVVVMWITLAITLTVISAALIWEQSLQSRALLEDNLQRGSRQLGSQLEILQVRASRAARIAAAQPDVVQALAVGQPARILSAIVPIAGIQEVTDITVVDAQDRVAGSLAHPTTVGAPAPPHGLPVDRAETRHGLVLHAGPTPATHRVEATAAAPVLQAGRYLGRVVATIQITAPELDGFRNAYGLEASVVGDLGGGQPPVRVVTSMYGKGEERLVGTGAPSAANSDHAVWLDEPSALAAYVALPKTGDVPLYLEVATPAALVKEMQARTIRTVALVGLLSLGLGTVLSLVLARRITGPLTELRRAAAHLAEGDYLHEAIPVRSNDEVGYLAGTFNEMASALQERDERLQTFSRNLMQGQKALEYVNDRLKREKNEIETILNSIPEGVLVLDPQGHVINTNHAASLLLTRRRADILGMLPSQVLDFVDPQMKPVEDVDALLVERRTLLPGEPLPSVEGFLVARDEAKVPVEIDSVPIQDEKLRYLGQVVIIRDITRKYEIDRLKEEFLAVITHQLKSPISALIGYAQILKEAELSDENLDIVENMKSLGEFLSLQIGNILTSTRLEANRMTYRVEHFPVATSFQDLARLFNPVSRMRGIHLVIDDPGDLFVHADIEKVHDILSNLVNNALKFTPAGGTIRVSASADEEAVRVRVKDTGKGIPADAQGRLFQKFYQVTGEGHGTGLGLYIARTMVENMGGKIGVHSVVREGTTFTVTLPRGRAESARRAAPSAPTLAATVLVADADRDINAFVRLYLERQGVQHVRQAFSAADARHIIEKDPPDAMVLGEDLGDRTGWALACDLKAQDGASLPIIYVTASPRDDADGIFAAQLARPLEPALLIEQLRTILHQHLQRAGGG